MAYSQDTIISPNAANTYVTVLQGLLTSAGWAIVETLTPSGTFRVQVWKSAAGANLAGYDWFLVIKWNTVGTEQNVEIIVGAAYDTGTHTLSQIPAQTRGGGGSFGNPKYSEPTTGDMWGALPVNTAVDTGTTAQSPHGQNAMPKPWYCIIVPSSAFAYWASITLDHVTIFDTIASNSYYHASTLDVDAAYAGLGYVNTHPLMAFTQSTIGVSASVIGSGTTSLNYRNPSLTINKGYGSPLPLLDGNYLDAYAWKPALFLTGLTGDGGTPLFDSPIFNDGILVGSGIDYYVVSGGSIGDTITISGATYVISGPIGPTGLPTGDRPTVAVLVE